MKLIRKEAALIAILVFCMGTLTFAQLKDPRYEFGINTGFLVYQGDLTPERLGSFKTQKLFLALQASRLFSPSFSLRSNLVFGELKGDDAKYNYPAYRQQRNFNFSSPLFELSALLVWNFTASNYVDKGISPYVFAGAGLTFLKIKRDWSHINTNYFSPESSDIWAALAADSIHKLPRLIPVIPVGTGINYFITPNWALSAETSFRFDFTDYLDGFSQAANPRKKDSYFSYSLGIIYRPGKKNRLGCPATR